MPKLDRMSPGLPLTAPLLIPGLLPPSPGNVVPGSVPAPGRAAPTPVGGVAGRVVAPPNCPDPGRIPDGTEGRVPNAGARSGRAVPPPKPGRVAPGGLADGRLAPDWPMPGLVAAPVDGRLNDGLEPPDGRLGIERLDAPVLIDGRLTPPPEKPPPPPEAPREKPPPPRETPPPPREKPPPRGNASTGISRPDTDSRHRYVAMRCPMSKPFA